MLSPRIRRLKLDYDTLMQRFANWLLIQVSGTAGMPPEVYRISYQIKGLYVSPTGEILERDAHQLEVNLSLGYPRRAPQCRMLAPVFHPNFDEGSVCIGDFWAASEGLDDLIVRIGRMIAYQEYNTKSPLNGLAAKWAAQNASLLPIDTRNIAPPSGAAEEAGVPGDAASVSQAENAPAALSGDPWSQKISLD
jgi:ubiquitin-protein ligase